MLIDVMVERHHARCSSVLAAWCYALSATLRAGIRRASSSPRPCLLLFTAVFCCTSHHKRAIGELDLAIADSGVGSFDVLARSLGGE
jgi:hypothetical protein